GPYGSGRLHRGSNAARRRARPCAHGPEPGHRGGAPAPEGRAMSEEIRVFLVDDHQLFLSGVRTELRSRFRIVGEAGDAEAAVAGIKESSPDVMLLDVHMPGGGGAAVIRAAAPELPDTRFLALSVSDAAEDVIDVIRAGARSYVTKSIAPD